MGAAAGGRGRAAGCNDKNKNPAIECGEKWEQSKLMQAALTYSKFDVIL